MFRENGHIVSGENHKTVQNKKKVLPRYLQGHCATGCPRLEQDATCPLKLTEIDDVGDPTYLVRSRILGKLKFGLHPLMVKQTSSLGRMYAGEGQHQCSMCSYDTYCLL
jgi:hypothetical protein